MSVDKSPVYEVKAVPVEKVLANDYNPNVVAPPEMKLLELSIWEDGFTMPCVCYYNKEEDNYILVDGYHRYTVLKTSKRIYKREHEHRRHMASHINDYSILKIIRFGRWIDNFSLSIQSDLSVCI